MTKNCGTTEFGEPLSAESKKRVAEVRRSLAEPIHPNFDTDFNVYRFVLNAERQFNKPKEIVENATKALNNHLRFRKALDLDTLPDIPFEENPIFRGRFLPVGQLLRATDSSGRQLWYVNYGTIAVEDIAHAIRSTSSCRYQFWQFEHMLKWVNHAENATGKLSSLRHVVDLADYEMNPFMMGFVSSGTLSYYSNLFHYEHYPELVYPIEIVNIAKWIHVPYRLVKTFMPAGFADRFRLYDNHFLDTLKEEIDDEHIPESLGGKNPNITVTPAKRLSPEEYWQPPNPQLLTLLEPFHVSAKKQKTFRVEVPAGEPLSLSWYFKTDGDIYFGVFKEPTLLAANGKVASAKGSKKEAEKEPPIDPDNKEMVYAFFKLTAKMVHEFDHIPVEPGTYHVLFCNRHSWLHRRDIEAMVQLSAPDGTNVKRVFIDGRTEPMSVENSIIPSLGLLSYKD